MSGVNRYTNINWNQPMSSYVKPPLEMLQAVGAGMQKNYEQSVDETYKLNDLMATVNSIDEHKPFKKVLENKYYPKLQEITDKIVNQGDMSAKRDLNRLAREWQNDPLRNELEKSYQDYNVDVKNVTKLKEEGKYTDVYDPFKSFKGISETGEINPYRIKGARPVQDYLKTGTGLMEGIKSSGSNGKSYNIDDNGNIIGLERGWEAIYQKDVDRVAQNSLIPFLKSNEGQFFIDEYKHRNPNATIEDIGNAGYNYLKNLGNKQIFNKTESGRDFKYSPWADDAWKAAADAKKQDYLNNPLDLLHPAVQTPQDLNKNNPFSDLFNFDDKGNAVVTPHNDGSMTEKYTYVTQGGETHEGIRTKPGMNDKLITKKVFAANEYYASIGKLDEMKKQFTKDGKLDVIAMSEQGLKDMAQNYKSGNLNSLSIAVFPEAVQNQMTNYILPKSTVAANGDIKVLNSGMISGMTLLDANGNNIPESEDNKIKMLTNASIIGPSYVHPDALRVSLPDGSEILLKTNSSNLANANSEITKFVQEASKAMTAPKSRAQQVYDDKLEFETNKNTISKLEKSTDPLDKYKLDLIKSKLEPLNNLRNQGFIPSTSTTLPNGDEVYVYTKYSVDGKPVDQKAIIMNPGIGGIRETTISNVAAEAYSYNFKVPAYNANVRNKVAKDVETFETTEDEQ